ncbi:hypothetical protein CFAM422_003599 [Trichoderma lentiforme]|uniref:Uncharacterized protein n=1 Tax=Trichoderma lentiforme TaxID=1567552 RepID=A0A9P4XLA5_9HYPO|nr:hypothetical protein CFAM422_003599 [Trichoderma lentiforme]
MAESTQSQAKRRRTSTAEISKYPVIAGYRISTYAAPGTVLTMNEQKIIYHAWKIILFTAIKHRSRIPEVAVVLYL